MKNKFPNIRSYRPGIIRKFSNSREYNLFLANYQLMTEFSSKTYENGRRTNIKLEVHNMIQWYIAAGDKIEDVIYIVRYEDCGIPFITIYVKYFLKDNLSYIKSFIGDTIHDD